MDIPLPDDPSPRKILLGTTVLYVAALCVYFHYTDGGNALEFSPAGLQNVGQTMAPLVAVAAFIERAVEIVISTTRGPHTLELQRALTMATTDKIARQRQLDLYKLQTQRYSFAVSIGISLFASMVGVRAVWPLMGLKPPEPRAFDAFDILITSLLLAGGCDGIHQVVTTITAFLDTSKSANKKKVFPPADGTPPAEE